MTKKNGAAAEILRSMRDRIVRLEEEKKAIADDVKSVYAEAKSQGFDVKALRIVVKRAMEDQQAKAKRRETEEIAELYLANLGMLDGTPLGDAARERMLPPAPEKDDDGGGSAASTDEPPEWAAARGAPARGAFTEADIDAARDQGAADSQAGKRIIDNPFVAGDPRRAAWDEGHCRDRQSDGMEIPESWRRKQRAKPDGVEKGAGA